MSLLTVGTVAFDTIETPFGKAEMVIGGACTYISWSASYFTNNIHLVSIVGDDFPKTELETLKKRGVNLDGLKIVEGGKSFFWAGRYHNNMNNRDTLVTDLNVLADFDPVLPEQAKSAKYVMLGNLTPAIQKSVLDQLDGSQKLIALDTMNFWMDIAMDELKSVISRIDLLTINDEEARQLSGEHSLVNAAKIIHEMGPKFLVIKKGEHGALLFCADDIFYAPALPLAQVYDPTGAGDTFAGGLMGYLTKTDDISMENMKRAIIAGSAMASFCVEDFSLNKLKSLTMPEIDERLGRFKKLMHFDLK
ncbi:MAG TPA: PfkB family carbohydrate kinase [Saprospiraceae bacterium]|jgi:sugar/nucleoside kinase (ribokinase family)|nr:bifunctional hydroxymethylpyrimidine kinase/phosphomethylpyrimidine kinase [Saprospiraceae bacterium]MBK8825963.1 bifunctional hydroxymethylpyrimidine kinase/phosphomethylpyrimidine kinase [Saprospiraceae bacterium]MBK9582249.1 bifunctional hydroxymethylpyrimidine kinase/phosphomethylpyrimidine kinase [Saprospiraceae bacterium]MBK9743280.1 bifunctional hydroxymethylpyrimidine kinase/phosphomethylpyrimidine kinase [Saprospiraceae bacterium]HMT53256.1 PfkB family carbohydrate kinase [Saprospir